MSQPRFAQPSEKEFKWPSDATPEEKAAFLKKQKPVSVATAAPSKAGAQQRPPAKGWFDRSSIVDEQTLDDFPVVNMARGAWNAAKAVPGALYDLATDVAPYDEQGNFKMPMGRTMAGLGQAQGQLGVESADAFKRGDYMTAATKGAKYLLPVVGPMMDAGERTMAEKGVAEGIGELGANAYMMATGFRTGAARPARTKPPVMRGPSNPVEAAAVDFARQRGVPLDLATATGKPGVRGWQKDTAHSWAGARVADDMRVAQDEGLLRVGNELTDQTAPGRPTSPYAAGEGVLAAIDDSIRQLHETANRAYGAVRKAEAQPQARPAPSNAMTALDVSQRTPLAVDLTAAVEQLQPLYTRLMREQELGVPMVGGKGRLLVTLDGLMNAPNWAPLSVVDQALSNLKAMARGADMPELRNAGQGGAARAVQLLDEQVQAAAARGGADVVKALQDGRAATAQKYRVAEVRDLLSAEPGQVFRQLTQGKDIGLERLKAVERVAPGEMQNIGRAFLEDLMELGTREGGFGHVDRLWSDWHKLGPQTKARLFPQAGHIKALDDFFMLAKQMKKDPNPAGTGTMPAVRATPQANVMEVVLGLPRYAAAKAMMDPAWVNRLTTSRRVPASVPRTTRAAAAGVVQNTSEMAPFRLPAAAEGEQEQPQQVVRMGQTVMVGGEPQLVMKVNSDGTFEAVPARRK